MTQEQKAKAYDEALERAKSWYIDAQIDFKKSLEALFPELKESEDEQIRKEIVSAINIYCSEYLRGTKVRNAMLAWLEKQGEKNPAYVEPKFKVGDWVVSGYNSVAYIESISETKYNLQCKDGSHEKMSIEYIDRCWHLWTIQDAKDGDVLAASDGSIFLFKCVVDCGCKHYVALTTDNIIKFNEGLEHYWETSRAVHPATKEQRDLLFQKMKEVGYEWDEKEKRLIKVPKTKEETGVLKQLIDNVKFNWTREDEDRLKSYLNILQPETFTGKVLKL